MFSLCSVLKLSLQSAWKNQSGKGFLLSLLLFGLVLGVFLPALRGEFIEFDDFAYVTGNPRLQLSPENLLWALSHGLASNWHPLTLWSLMLDHRLYGFNPWGYHLTNVLLHALNSVLVFLVLRRLTGALWRSLLVAALFGLHPLRVESVAWISERKDVLCVLFWMLSLWAYARFAQFKAKADTAVPALDSRLWSLDYALTLLFFALSLMSKPMAVTLPAVLLLLDFWPLQRWPKVGWRRLTAEKIPFFLLSALGCVITFVAQKNAGMMKELVGVSLSFDLRFGNALVAYARYMGKLFWPADLCAFYPHPGRWPLVDVLLAGVLLLGLSALVVAGRRQRPYWLTGWFWFLGTLVPIIGLIQVGAQGMADRYSYIPSLGILMIGVWEFHRLTEGGRWRNLVRWITGAGLVLACILLTCYQITFWRDGVCLWRRAVAVTHNNYDAHNRLGSALLAQGAVAAAIREFQEAIRLNPAFAEPWCSLGYVSNMQGNLDGAIACYQKALEIQPKLVVARMSLGNLLLNAGRVDDAILNLQAAANLDPRLAAAADSLGRAFSLKGRWDEAIVCFQRALEIQPDSATTWNGLGLAFLRAERFDEALAAFQKAVAILPGDDAARNNLGYAFLRTRRVDEAIREFHVALKQRPANAEIHNNLGTALLANGQVDEAIPEFREALRLKPTYADASRNLAFALRLKEKLPPPPTNSMSP